MTTALHAAIAESLRERIRGGSLIPGQAVPSEAELCAEWNASRAPIRQAMATLRAEGLISGGRGRRSTVSAQALAQPIDSLMSYSSWAHSLGRIPGQRTVELGLRTADEEAAGALHIDAGSMVVQGLRVRTLDAVPTMLERALYVEQVGRLLFEFDSDAGSQWEFLKSRGVVFASASHVIDAVAADTVDAAWLGVDKGSPLLRQRRTTRDAEGAVIEYHDDRYRPTEVAFTIQNTPDMRIPLARSINP
ncbi:MULTISPECIES: GntR family transcriptional regulator [Rhodococcus]|uniref:GntR family transcriptional regulator n=1 Tax=Rhodococcus TaxID=1827 RepID=UPI0025B612A5|nr:MULTISPECIES: GntR family transcriptional regulator [Rhodococcus]MDN3460082.1 GntR family transcriptional regulator [Rhodococcus sp. APC 3903]MDT9664800.1 GntR family transcriptional regulator [Rhodococcus qingshengii]